MLRELNIGFQNHEIANSGVLPIRYNILKRLNRIKYISYRKIEIEIGVGDKVMHIWWDDKKTASIKVDFPKELLRDMNSLENIDRCYAMVFDCLKVLWHNNNWPTEDLDQAYSEIRKEEFRSYVFYGRTSVSPNKKSKVEFLCELFLGYADYSIEISKPRKRAVERIFLGKGHPEPALFFGFFTNRKWVSDEIFLLSDFNNEIFFRFDLQSLTCSIEFEPRYNTLEECQKYLGMVKFD